MPVDHQREIAEALEFYSQYYNDGRSWLLNSMSPELVLGGTSAKQRCRFCNKSVPFVSFKKRAHAVSEMIGNKSLFVDYECDACNQRFGETLENHLGNWSKPLRTVFQIPGKKGVPAIRSRDKTSRISVKTGILNLDYQEGHLDFYENPITGEIAFTAYRDSYRPLLVLKALTKSALNLIPDDRIELFKETIAWTNDVDGRLAMFEKQGIATQYALGLGITKSAFAAVFFRTNDQATLPYCQFLLAFGNATIQMAIPSWEKDRHIIGRRGAMPFFPFQDVDYLTAYGSPVRLNEEMSAFEVARSSGIRFELKQQG